MSKPGRFLWSVSSTTNGGSGTRSMTTQHNNIFHRPPARSHAVSLAGPQLHKKQYQSFHDLKRLEAVFIQALVTVTACHKPYPSTLQQRTSPHNIRTSRASPLRNRSFAGSQARRYSNQVGLAAASPITSPKSYDLSKDEMKGLVDFYDTRSPESPSTHPTRLEFSKPEKKSIFTPQSHTLPLRSPPYKQHLRRLAKLLADPETPHGEVYQAYTRLPPPRTKYLDDRLLQRLLHHFEVVPARSETAMLRYLSVVDDAKGAGRQLTAGHWNSAIAFTGLWVSQVSSAEVESALYLWREQELEAGVKSTNVTFNILFDTATKAGQFVLAELILEEMKARGLALDRYFRTSLMYHYGKRGDGDGVRRAYGELVEAGEIVDSAVMTCVIKSLLSAGEAVAAEHVFARMKELHAAKSNSPLPPQQWRRRHDLGSLLNRLARRYTGDLANLARIQSQVPLAPSFATYRVLVYHYAVSAGDIDRVMELIHEMAHYNIPSSGRIYMYILKGFERFGGSPYTSWTPRRLEDTWQEYLDAIDADREQVYIGRAAASLVVKAYARCTDYQRTKQVLGECQTRWVCSAEDRAHVEEVFMSLFQDHVLFNEDGHGDGAILDIRAAPTAETASDAQLPLPQPVRAPPADEDNE